MTGRYAFLGEAWEAVALIAVVIGLAGIVTGVLVTRLLVHPLRVPQGAVAAAIFADLQQNWMELVRRHSC